MAYLTFWWILLLPSFLCLPIFLSKFSSRDTELNHPSKGGPPLDTVGTVGPQNRFLNALALPPLTARNRSGLPCRRRKRRWRRKFTAGAERSGLALGSRWRDHAVPIYQRH